jgi:hypothetical protein
VEGHHHRLGAPESPPVGATPVVAHMESVARDGLVAHEASAACAALGTRDSGSHLASCATMDGPMDADACQRTGQARGPAPTSVTRCRPANRTQRGVVVRDSMIDMICDVVGSMSAIWPWGAPPWSPTWGRLRVTDWLRTKPRRPVLPWVRETLARIWRVVRRWMGLRMRTRVNGPGRHGGLPLHR